MKTSSILVLCAFLLGTSCQKDIVLEDHSGIDPSPVTSIANIGDTITFGLADNMLIDSDSVVLQSPWNSSVTYPMDVDADGTTDFQIFMTAGATLGSGSWQTTKLKCMHPNVTVRSFQRTDTTFFHVDTINTNVNRYYSCRRMGPFDTFTIGPSNVTKFLGFQSGDLLTTLDAQYSDTLWLRRSNSSMPIPIFEPPYQIQTTTIYDCFLMPLDEVQYIGFAVLDGNGDERLGWLKLESVSWPRTMIYEQAIQAP